MGNWRQISAPSTLVNTSMGCTPPSTSGEGCVAAHPSCFSTAPHWCTHDAERAGPDRAVRRARLLGCQDGGFPRLRAANLVHINPRGAPSHAIGRGPIRRLPHGCLPLLRARRPFMAEFYIDSGVYEVRTGEMRLHSLPG